MHLKHLSYILMNLIYVKNFFLLISPLHLK